MAECTTIWRLPAILNRSSSVTSPWGSLTSSASPGRKRLTSLARFALPLIPSGGQFPCRVPKSGTSLVFSNLARTRAVRARRASSVTHRHRKCGLKMGRIFWPGGVAAPKITSEMLCRSAPWRIQTSEMGCVVLLPKGKVRNMQLSDPSAGLSCTAATLPPNVCAPAMSGTDSPSLTFRVYRDLDDLRQMQECAEELSIAYPEASIFSSLDWLVSWWETFHNSQPLMVLAAFDATSRLAGLAALYLSQERFLRIVPLRCLRFVGDGSGDSDNLDFVVRPGFEDAFANELLEHLREQKDQWDIVRLNTTPADSPVANRIEQLLRRRQWTSFTGMRDRSSILLPASWEEYLATLSSEDGKNILRYRRRIERRYSLRVYRCDHQHELPACLEGLFRLHQLRWQGRGESGTFAGRERRQFYERLSLRLLASNRLEFWILELDGRIAAAQFAMRYRNNVYQLQEGYDPAHSSDRVGMVLRAEVLRRLISEGVRIYDFLGGTDQYKQRWGASRGQYRDITFATAWSVGSVALKSAYYGKVMKEWLRLHLPRGAWRILHRIKVSSEAQLLERTSEKPEPTS